MGKPKKILLIKIGSSTLTRDTDQISKGKLEDMARQIVNLNEEYHFIIVSSGAIATAKQFMSLSDQDPIAVKQAMAAIGQPLLMNMYQDVFGDFGLKVAQCLLHYHDFQNDKSVNNIKNTITTLLKHNYIPIINENDTVATEEILFGDNDKLAAMVAAILDVHLLILASNVDGLYDTNASSMEDYLLIEEVKDIEKVKHLVKSEMVSKNGTGGMASKLQAAKICQDHGIEMWLVNGSRDGFIEGAIEGKYAFTKFI